MNKQKLDRSLPWILVIGGFIGLIAAFVLTLERIAILSDPSHQLSCSINPVLSCGSIIASDQASLIGFPNPLIGLMAYTVVVTVGMALLAGAKFRKWFWQSLSIGSLIGMLFVIWLIYQSLYTIGALCVYCMVAWTVTWPIFWYSLLYNLRNKHIKTPKSLARPVDFLQNNHANILIAWYLLVVLAILENFWYYWKTLF